MPLLTMREYPDPILRQKAKNVDLKDPRLPGIVRDLFETMYHHSGVGLAANQVGLDLNLTVIDCSGGDEPHARLVLINPVVLGTEGTVEEDEGCLSFPGLRAIARRGEFCRVRAYDLEGNVFEIESGGLLGKALQHETDHLAGKLFIDHLTLASRASVEGKLKQMKKDYQPQDKKPGARA